MKKTVVPQRVIPTLKNMKQVYENYTPEDQLVWGILYDRQISNIPFAVTREFLKGLEKVRFNRNQIPNFEVTNDILSRASGWQLVAVEGIVDDRLFFELLAQRKFPATTWLRKMDELDYLEEPDMFHDVFAHVPLLVNRPFVDFLENLAKIALIFIDNSRAIDLLTRIYWYTVEFGLIREEEQLRIYGAGILSSSGETNYSLSDQPDHLNFDVATVLGTVYHKDEFQERYFIIESFEKLYNSVDQIQSELEQMILEEVTLQA